MHTFREIKVDGDVPADAFNTAIPDGRVPVERRQAAKPPLPIGEPAPDFGSGSNSGKQVIIRVLRFEPIYNSFLPFQNDKHGREQHHRA